MKKPRGKRIQGFASFLALLAVALLIVSGFAVYNQGAGFAVYNQGGNLSDVPKNVLSESDSKNENSELSSRADEEAEKKEDSEPVETPEPVETVEPAETPEPLEFEEERDVEVKKGNSESKIKIRSGKNKFEFQQEGAKFSVESNFPLSVDPLTRELSVETPSGSSVVSVLPQQVIDNMFAAGIVTATSGVDLKTESDGSLTYDIDGTKSEKLLGVFDVAIPKNLIVSAQTGEMLTVNQSTFSKILDFLSI